MSDYNSALYFAREAAIKYQKSGKCWDAEDAAQRLVGLIAVLDAARAAPPAALAVPAPSAEDAQRMGEQGGPAVESERLAFEAWMRGHCWGLGAVWNGKGYIGMNEEDGFVCPQATRTRGLWAAWRDRAALAQQPVAAVPEGYALVPVEPTREMVEAGEYALYAFTAKAVYGAMVYHAQRAMLSADQKD